MVGLLGHQKLDFCFDLSVVSVVSPVVAAPIAVTQPRQEAVAVTIAISSVASIATVMISIATVMTSIATMVSSIAPVGVVTIRVVTIRVIATVTISRMSLVQVMHVIASTEEGAKLCFPKY